MSRLTKSLKPHVRAKVIIISYGESVRMYRDNTLPSGYATREELSDPTLTVYKIEGSPGYRIKR